MIEFIGIFLWKIVEIVCEMAKILYYEYRKREDDFILGVWYASQFLKIKNG